MSIFLFQFQLLELFEVKKPETLKKRKSERKALNYFGFKNIGQQACD
jgi:hypothetical protein